MAVLCVGGFFSASNGHGRIPLAIALGIWRWKRLARLRSVEWRSLVPSAADDGVNTAELKNYHLMICLAAVLVIVSVFIFVAFNSDAIFSSENVFADLEGLQRQTYQLYHAGEMTVNHSEEALKGINYLSDIDQTLQAKLAAVQQILTDFHSQFDSYVQHAQAVNTFASSPAVLNVERNFRILESVLLVFFIGVVASCMFSIFAFWLSSSWLVRLSIGTIFACGLVTCLLLSAFLTSSVTVCDLCETTTNFLEEINYPSDTVHDAVFYYYDQSESNPFQSALDDALTNLGLAMTEMQGVLSGGNLNQTTKVVADQAYSNISRSNALVEELSRLVSFDRINKPIMYAMDVVCQSLSPNISAMSFFLLTALAGMVIMLLVKALGETRLAMLRDDENHGRLHLHRVIEG
jgi:hypothetical protein